MVKSRYLCSAPRPETWDERAEALLNSLGGSTEKIESTLKQTLESLKAMHADKQKTGPGRKSNAEHAIAFYEYVLETINEKKEEEENKKKGKDNDTASTTNDDDDKKPAATTTSTTEDATTPEPPPQPVKRKRGRPPKNKNKLMAAAAAAARTGEPPRKKPATQLQVDTTRMARKDRSPDDHSIASMDTQEFINQHNDLCEVCSKGGELLMCSTCNLVFHLACVRPKMEEEPEDSWVCAYCIMSGVKGLKQNSKLRKNAAVAVRLMARMRKSLQRQRLRSQQEEEGENSADEDDDNDKLREARINEHKRLQSLRSKFFGNRVTLEGDEKNDSEETKEADEDAKPRVVAVKARKATEETKDEEGDRIVVAKRATEETKEDDKAVADAKDNTAKGDGILLAKPTAIGKVSSTDDEVKEDDGEGAMDDTNLHDDNVKVDVEAPRVADSDAKPAATGIASSSDDEVKEDYGDSPMEDGKQQDKDKNDEIEEEKPDAKTPPASDNEDADDTSTSKQGDDNDEKMDAGAKEEGAAQQGDGTEDDATDEEEKEPTVLEDDNVDSKKEEEKIDSSESKEEVDSKGGEEQMDSGEDGEDNVEAEEEKVQSKVAEEDKEKVDSGAEEEKVDTKADEEKVDTKDDEGETGSKESKEETGPKEDKEENEPKKNKEDAGSKAEQEETTAKGKVKGDDDQTEKVETEEAPKTEEKKDGSETKTPKTEETKDETDTDKPANEGVKEDNEGAEEDNEAEIMTPLRKNHTPTIAEAVKMEDDSGRYIRRNRKKATYYDPGTRIAASKWQTDGVWKAPEQADGTRGSDDDDEMDDEYVDEAQATPGKSKEGTDEAKEGDGVDIVARDVSPKKAGKEGAPWCNFCKDDKTIVVCCFCACRVCFGKHEQSKLLLCDRCDDEYHTFCLDPPLKAVPSTGWFCPSCVAAEENLSQVGTRASKTMSSSGTKPAAVPIRSSGRKSIPVLSPPSPKAAKKESPKATSAVAQPVKRGPGRPRKHPLPEEAPPRKRGRPPKNKTPPPPVESPPPRKRGRPRKHPLPEPAESSTSKKKASPTASEPEPTVKKRGPGRPPKVKTAPEPTPEPPVKKRGPGRPPKKPKTPPEEEPAPAPAPVKKRGPGRPPKVKTPPPEPEPVVVVPRKRGRPPKTPPPPPPEPEPESEPESEPEVVVPKKRGPGRPPKVSRKRSKSPAPPKKASEAKPKAEEPPPKRAKGGSTTAAAAAAVKEKTAPPEAAKPAVKVSRSGRTVKRTSFHDEIDEGEQHLKSVKYAEQQRKASEFVSNQAPEEEPPFVDPNIHELDSHDVHGLDAQFLEVMPDVGDMSHLEGLEDNFSHEHIDLGGVEPTPVVVPAPMPLVQQEAVFPVHAEEDMKPAAVETVHTDSVPQVQAQAVAPVETALVHMVQTDLASLPTTPGTGIIHAIPEPAVVLVVPTPAPAVETPTAAPAPEPPKVDQVQATQTTEVAAVPVPAPPAAAVPVPAPPIAPPQAAVPVPKAAVPAPQAPVPAPTPTLAPVPAPGPVVTPAAAAPTITQPPPVAAPAPAVAESAPEPPASVEKLSGVDEAVVPPIQAEAATLKPPPAASAASGETDASANEPTVAAKTPRRKPGARECMQISRRFGVCPPTEKQMSILLDYCKRGKVEHLIRMRERLDEHSGFLEQQIAGLEALVQETGETDVVVPAMPEGEQGEGGA
ncbi:protein ligase UHRF1 [Seminavis robusta]|uniref:Protein ligase UHRF1 n=1 Tax=Seminavis robusta TaxID=568900 RepID=A0A9N8ENW6_9STRA|nr:protein ligase UHRF1 [Seminavis robusta]|eukprot:Sro1496_g277520.1 protein ligase UHRF1 (1686) ;mRNA; r:12645-18098